LHHTSAVDDKWIDKENVAPPDDSAERAYPKLIHYNKLEKDGYFAAWEQPERFIVELRNEFRFLRAAAEKSAA